MQDVAYATALVLAAVFAAAAVAKLRDPQGTRTTFAALGLPGPFASVVPAVEILLVVGLVLVPGWAGVASLALLAGFTTYLARAVRRGVEAPCNCFGSRGEQPVSSVEIVRNASLLLAGAVAATSAGPRWPGVGSSALVVAAVAAVGLGLRQVRHSRQHD
jgi:uncharacterized membrane protein YphA (DoxX/SURF4 family)